MHVTVKCLVEDSGLSFGLGGEGDGGRSFH